MVVCDEEVSPKKLFLSKNNLIIKFRTKKGNDNTKPKITEEVDLEQSTSDRRNPATRFRKLTLFLILDLWMVILVCFLFNIHFNTYQKIGANLNSVQFMVGDGTMTTMDIEEFMLTRLDEVNEEMQKGREILEEALDDLSKFDKEIYEKILNKIEVISDKNGWMLESTGNLQDFMKEAIAKWTSLILSFSFFLTYIIVTWFGLTKVSKLFSNQFVMSVVTLLGHILMFIFIIALYNYVITDVLERIHPQLRLYVLTFGD